MAGPLHQRIPFLVVFAAQSWRSTGSWIIVPQLPKRKNITAIIHEKNCFDHM